MSTDERVKVAYIGGYSRSGSTLLDCMLGQLPGFFSTGELAYIWTHGLQENRLCGCGDRFLDCAFWHQVGDVGFGGWQNVDANEMRALELRVNRHRFLPQLVAPRLSPKYERDLRAYAAVLARLYSAIRTVSGRRVVVDSTIDPAYGFLLRHVQGLELKLVHMVRDSRATAFSWTRWQRRTDRVDTVMYQRRFRPPMTAVRWSGYHLLVHLLGQVDGGEVLIRYENVVRSPKEEIKRILEHVGETIDDGDLGFIRDGVVDLKATHTVAGSLMRLRQGPLPVRVDDEWETRLSERDRRLVTTLTWPLLRMYGYVGAERGEGEVGSAPA